jgi:hypothetical protein
LKDIDIPAFPRLARRAPRRPKLRNLLFRKPLAADPVHTARFTGSIFTADLFGIIVVSDKSSRRRALPLSNPPKLRIAGELSPGCRCSPASRALSRITRKSAALLELRPGKLVYVQAKSVALLA